MVNIPVVFEESAGAKRYSTIKLSLSLFGTILNFLITVAIVATGVSSSLSAVALSVSSSPYCAMLIMIAGLGIITGFVEFPLGFYSGYILEHRYKLSNQTIPQWLFERGKGMLVGVCIAVPVLLLLYYSLREFGAWWWLPTATCLVLLSIVLARLAPIMIMPLFYKFVPLDESVLKKRMLELCAETTMRVQGVYSFNLSKTTKKANAAFTGVGTSKRIMLGDTLLQNFSTEEIEVVFTHELGHYVHGHLWKGIVFGTISIFIGLFLTSIAYNFSLVWFGFSTLDALAALPLLGIWLGLYSFLSSPLENFVSRTHEYEADRYALVRTKNPTAFVTTMKKLASMNLADPTPHPVIEFLFYSHPSIEKRIQLAGQF